jgi:hypothetical protein
MASGQKGDNLSLSITETRYFVQAQYSLLLSLRAI